MEILSPAGSVAALKAAVFNGADAVYLGLSEFNARMGAENFTKDNIAESVAFCHRRGVRVHAVLNTLVSNREMPLALETAKTLAAAGVDRCGTSRVHTTLRPFVGRSFFSCGYGLSPRRSGARTFRSGDREHNGAQSDRDRGFLPRRDVHGLQRTVLYVRDRGTEKRKQRQMRAAVPLAVCGRVRTQPERYEPFASRRSA